MKVTLINCFGSCVGNKIHPPSNAVNNLYLKVNFQFFSENRVPALSLIVVEYENFKVLKINYMKMCVVFETLPDQTRSINLFVKSTIILPYFE